MLMRKLLKITLITLLLLLVLFAMLAEMQFFKRFPHHLEFALYLKLISLLGMLIALIMVWSHKQKTVASQKFQRANQVLAEAEKTAQRKQNALEQLEKKLKREYAKKDQGLDGQIYQIKSGFEQRIKVLNEQNIELKDTVSKLMRALKKERKDRK
jgi:DNA anti-recombination protein RmuC